MVGLCSQLERLRSHPISYVRPVLVIMLSNRRSSPLPPSPTTTVWETPIDEIGDFGLGVFLYYKMLVTLFFTMVVCICLNLPAAAHYMSTDYQSDLTTRVPAVRANGVADWKLSFGGNVVCEDIIPVCTNAAGCECTVFSKAAINDWYGPVAEQENALYNVTGTDCYPHSNCTMKWDLAYWDAGMLGFLIVGLFLLTRFQDSVIEEADEAEQTAQDYSIMVQDPDADATNPDEWQQVNDWYSRRTLHKAPD